MEDMNLDALIASCGGVTPRRVAWMRRTRTYEGWVIGAVIVAGAAVVACLVLDQLGG